MPRARRPVTFDDVIEATSHDYYPDITGETKPEDFGFVGDRVLALDYGLWDAEDVTSRRAYYASKAATRT